MKPTIILTLHQHSPESDILPNSKSPASNTERELASALAQPVVLEPVAIPKPWGQEIWYTGMEARGESGVHFRGKRLLLSEYLALAPQDLCGAEPPQLLKILDPTAESYLGDLYFEVHERKQEVYVVTHVDAGAWPSGVGGIRYGMNQRLRQQYANDDQFRGAYLAAVQAYEVVRRRIDEQVNTTAADQQLEVELRGKMEAFTELRPLRVGDVVTVDPWFPHSLQHGVRVVELQTPTYERLIISFAQQVLTQPHWDSARAVGKLSLEPAPALLTQSQSNPLQQIADFSDFRAFTLQLAPNSNFIIPEQQSYALAMCISGSCCLGERASEIALQAEQAVVLPKISLPQTLRNQSNQPCQVVLGGPPHLRLPH